MTAIRAAAIAIGVVIAGYGFALLWDNTPVILLRIVVWAVAGVVVHDLVFAPLCVAVGFTGRRLIPRNWWGPVAIAALCSVVLLLLAVPVFDRPGLKPDNPTVLDRNYPLGLWISLALVWVGVPLYQLATRWLPVGEDHVVEHEGADDVDRQPPPV